MRSKTNEKVKRSAYVPLYKYVTLDPDKVKEDEKKCLRKHKKLRYSNITLTGMAEVRGRGVYGLKIRALL
jgi:hypothetical protein